MQLARHGVWEVNPGSKAREYMFPSPSEMGRKAKGEGRRQKEKGKRRKGEKAKGKRQKAKGKRQKAKGKRPRARKRKKQRGLDCTASGCIVMACELTVQA